MGVLTARELTHGFDTLGSKYDERGNVHDWWSPDDRKQFDEAASCVTALVSEGMPKSEHDAPPIHLPTAESNADSGGLRVAYRALMDALVAQGKAADDKVDGYTESQRFFLSFAQSACESIRSTRQTTKSAHAAFPWGKCGEWRRPELRRARQGVSPKTSACTRRNPAGFGNRPQSATV